MSDIQQIMKKAFIHSPELDQGGYPDECPFNSKRAGMTMRILNSMNLLEGDDMVVAAPEKLSMKELELFHTPEYLDAIKRVGQGKLDTETLSMNLGSLDCPIFSNMFDYLSLAAGGTVTGAKMILDGDTSIAFNPSGGFHHAGPDYASGFCYLNDIVLAAQLLASAGRRVAFLDLDAHHCDGVQDAFYKNENIMTISMHQDGRTLFPGTGSLNEIGEGKGKGFTINLPLPVGIYDDAYKHAYNAVVHPILKAYDADVIMIELGMDALAGDPMAHLRLSNNVYVDILKDVLSLDKAILATGGGGYHLDNTIRAWALSWQILCQEEDYSEIMGMGGVLMESTEWSGGLRDRMLIVDAETKRAVDRQIDYVIQELSDNIFPLHGLE